jgi:hypothetical protein
MKQFGIAPPLVTEKGIAGKRHFTAAATAHSH